MGSRRLPGKVLRDLAGRPALAWVVRAARASIGVDDTWVATSVAAADDVIAAWCKANSVPVFRGSEGDVLGRYAGAIGTSGADIVVRLTADCPFLDPAIVGQTVRLRAACGVDYACNVDPPSWPDGLDCEVITTAALLAAAAEATCTSDREHVTPFVRNNRARFLASNLLAPLPGLAEERWTLDNPEDYALLSRIAAHLAADRPPSFLEILAVLDREPHLRDINRHLLRNAGYHQASPGIGSDAGNGCSKR